MRGGSALFSLDFLPLALDSSEPNLKNVRETAFITQISGEIRRSLYSDGLNTLPR